MSDERVKSLELAMMAFQQMIGQRDNPEFVNSRATPEEWDETLLKGMARLSELPVLGADVEWLNEQWPQYSGAEVSRKLQAMRLPLTGIWVDMLGALPTRGLPGDPYYPGDLADRCLGAVLAPNMVEDGKHTAQCFAYSDEGEGVPVTHFGVMGFATAGPGGVSILQWPSKTAPEVILGIAERAIRAVEYNLGATLALAGGFGKSTMRSV